MPFRRLLVILLVLVIGTATACADEREGADYDAGADAAAQVDTALARASTRDVPVLAVFGANWCHDSRGLAHRLQTNESLAAFLAAEYELVFIDIGQRDRNLDQLARFGVDQIFGTPTVVVAEPGGTLLNSESVHDWRTADNAGPAEVGAYLAHFAEVELPIEAEAAADLSAAIEAWPAYQNAMTALQDSDLSDDARAIRAAYYTGFARSMARRALGQEAEAREVHAIDRANQKPGSVPLDDLTEAVIERLNERDMDLVARGNRELQRYEAEGRADALTDAQP